MSPRQARFGCKATPWLKPPVWWWVKYPDGTSTASAAETPMVARLRAEQDAERRGYKLVDE